jgi:hypothetical protein
MGAAMQKYLIITTFIIFVVSCTSMSTINKVLQTDVPFQGGVGADKEWSEELTFKRTSWYHEAHMTNDLMVANLKKDSPFVAWLGTAKKNVFSDCSQFFVTLYRIHNFKKASKGRLIDPFTGAGMEEINIVEFKDSIKNHPTFSGLHLENYNVTGFCMSSKTPQSEKLTVKLPGFRSINVL